jgi:hypothetical protein
MKYEKTKRNWEVKENHENYRDVLERVKECFKEHGGIYRMISHVEKSICNNQSSQVNKQD